MPPPKTGAFRKGAASTNPDRIKDKGDTSKRDKSTIQRLNMYKSGKPIRDKTGKILGGDFLSKDKAGNEKITAVTGRVQPDRRWFGNTRVVGAKELDSFRDALSARMHDPYAVVLNARSLPMGLLADSKATARANLLSAESFSGTFGAKAQRKRVKLGGGVGDLAALASTANSAAAEYHSEEHVDRDRVDVGDGDRTAARQAVFDKGQSRRIWGELYKVLDCSDVVVQVLDARDPMGTRSPVVERFLKENAKHKHMVLLLNKVDLVPTWVTRRWVAALSAEYPTLAFHASLTKPFGKGALIALLRQFSRLHSDKKNISVGFVGFPNAGKSSVINALAGKKVCTVAPIPGETKTWQYITLMKRIFVVDSPGVVPPNANDSEASIVLKGVVRHTKLEVPEEYMPDLFERVKPAHLTACYGVKSWADPLDFCAQVAVKQGRFAAGEPDVSTVARNIILDWTRGKLPHYRPPPDAGPGSSAAGGAAALKDKSGSGGGAVSHPAPSAAAPSSSSSGAATAAAPSSLPAGITLAPQVLPRLGAHTLLEEEEEAGDREQAPWEAMAEGGGAADDDDEEEKGEDDEMAGGNEDGAEAPAPRSKHNGKPVKPSFTSAKPSSSLSSSLAAAKSSSSSSSSKAVAGRKRARPQETVEEAGEGGVSAAGGKSASVPAPAAAVVMSATDVFRPRKKAKKAVALEASSATAAGASLSSSSSSSAAAAPASAGSMKAIAAAPAAAEADAKPKAKTSSNAAKAARAAAAAAAATGASKKQSKAASKTAGASAGASGDDFDGLDF